ncbi:MAG: FdtA/QdtA family cupin domain-containing protein [Alteromonadaceae bacterium]
MSLIKLLEINSLGDDRGELVSLEANKSIPFAIKRVYYIFNTKQGVTRGFHAHKALRQVAFCIAGHCQITLDDGKKRESVTLNSPTKGLLIEHMQWREMKVFSSDCILMVIASEHYDEEDYIRDYNDFLESVKNA